MSKIASNDPRNHSAYRTALLGGAATLCFGLAIASMTSPASAQDKILQLMSSTVGWISQGPFLDPPAGTGHGPIKQHPAHPFHGNLDGPGQVTPAIGNQDDPVLKPWAAAAMKATSDAVLSGKMSLPFTAQSRCYPGGVPGQLLYPIEPMYFPQSPKQVWMIWQRDHMVRRIYLADKHSEVVKPSWFGDRSGASRRANFRRYHRLADQEQLHRQLPHTALREAARHRALQDRQQRQYARSLHQGRRPRRVQRAALHDQALAQVGQSAARDRVPRKQRRLLL
jgi:hypothetical protein